jgi:plastocyanin
VSTIPRPSYRRSPAVSDALAQQAYDKEQRPMRARQSIGLAATAITLLALTTACGGSDDSSGSDEPPVTIEIVEDGGQISPADGHVVKVDVGQEVQLNVSADVDDEIHVHTEPDHEYEVKAGEDASYSFTVDSPGVYPIESHGLEITLVKLQVS